MRPQRLNRRVVGIRILGIKPGQALELPLGMGSTVRGRSCSDAIAMEGGTPWVQGKPAGNPRPAEALRPQSTDTVVPGRPWSLRAQKWARSAGMKRIFLTGLPLRPGHRVALMAIGLDAIWIDMHHQSTDLAAGTGGDCHGRNGVGHPQSDSRLSGCKDCVSSPA